MADSCDGSFGDVQERVDRAHKMLFGNGKVEDSILWRLKSVETTQARQGKMLWTLISGVGLIVFDTLHEVFKGTF